MSFQIINNKKIKNTPLLKLSENSPLPVLWIFPDGRIFHANSAASSHFGYPMPELVNLHIQDLDPLLGSNATPKEFQRLKEAQLIRFETKHLCKNGSIVISEVISHYVSIDDLEFAVCYVIDTTDKHKTEKELRQKTTELEKINKNLEQLVSKRTKDLEEKVRKLEETEKRLKISEKKFIEAFKTSKDSININRLEDGTYLEINDGFTYIMGYTAEEVIGKPSLDLNIWKNPEDRARLVAGLKANGGVHDLEAEFVHKDGHTVYGIMSASIQEINGEKVLLNVSKDISKLKMLEKELKDLNQNLMDRIKHEVEIRQKQESLLFEQKKFADMGQMINAIAHQWRQPLNALGLMIQDITDSYKREEIDSEYLKYFEDHTLRLISHMSETIDQFRNFFKTSREIQSFNVSETIYEVFDLINSQLTIKNITYCIECKSKGNKTVLYNHHIKNTCACELNGFQGEFKQALMNIIYNAVDAIENRKQMDANFCDGSITAGISSMNGYTEITLSDNGGGIPADYVDKIFDPFFTTKGTEKGTGIGLYMTRLIIEKHFKGKISAANAAKGAVITISIPASK